MVRVRIGPSPTGDPHVGTAYVALFNYAFAKKHGGEFILRIEDTDQARSDPAWEAMIIDALKWLGLTWDFGPDVGGPDGPYRQSERGDIYRKHVAQLVANGQAYPCFCSTERLSQLRIQQRQRGVASGYDGACRHLDPQHAEVRVAAQEPHVIRLRVPKEGQIGFRDELRGPITFEADQIDDQVLQKSDGLPTYHLANVVDDHLMGITHVIRAEEWITSTPKHVLLYRAFGWDAPQFVHMPLLRNSDKSKISKRKNPVSLNHYREAGYLPEAMLNYLAMMGWTMPDGREKFDLATMIEALTLERITLGGPVFDVSKLTWLNGLYLREEPSDRLVQRLTKEMLSESRLRAVMPLVHERIEKLEDFFEHASFFFTGDVTYEPGLVADMIGKKADPKATQEMLEAVLALIDRLALLKASSLEHEMRELAVSLGVKTKELFMPTRIAVTGRKATPPLFDTMAQLGKERCRRRLRGALRTIAKFETKTENP